MEAMKSYGWGIVDSKGVMASSLIFRNLKAADQFRQNLHQLHPERECALVELFAKSSLD